MDEAFGRALANLERGARFFGAGLRTIADSTIDLEPAPIAGRYRARVLANGLRELDRFLNLLIDEARRLHGLGALPDQRNTASKLRAYRTALDQPDADEPRLRALQRSRDCLFHCEGRVMRGDDRDAPLMTTGWPEVAGTQAPLRRLAMGDKLTVDGGDLAEVCAFYRHVAQDIAETVQRLSAPAALPHAPGTTPVRAAARVPRPAGAAPTRCANRPPTHRANIAPRVPAPRAAP